LQELGDWLSPFPEVTDESMPQSIRNFWLCFAYRVLFGSVTGLPISAGLRPISPAYTANTIASSATTSTRTPQRVYPGNYFMLLGILPRNSLQCPCGINRV
jgi:hypothetical protein